MMRGTQRHPWRGLPATGRSFTVLACAIFLFAEADQIAAARVSFNSEVVLRQLGLMPPPEGG